MLRAYYIEGVRIDRDRFVFDLGADRRLEEQLQLR
jgi:hypothetical protein